MTVQKQLRRYWSVFGPGSFSFGLAGLGGLCTQGADSLRMSQRVFKVANWRVFRRGLERGKRVAGFTGQCVEDS